MGQVNSTEEDKTKTGAHLDLFDVIKQLKLKAKQNKQKQGTHAFGVAKKTSREARFADRQKRLTAISALEARKTTVEVEVKTLNARRKALIGKGTSVKSTDPERKRIEKLLDDHSILLQEIVEKLAELQDAESRIASSSGRGESPGRDTLEVIGQNGSVLKFQGENLGLVSPDLLASLRSWGHQGFFGQLLSVVGGLGGSSAQNERDDSDRGRGRIEQLDKVHRTVKGKSPRAPATRRGTDEQGNDELQIDAGSSWFTVMMYGAVCLTIMYGLRYGARRLWPETEDNPTTIKLSDGREVDYRDTLASIVGGLAAFVAYRTFAGGSDKAKKNSNTLFTIVKFFIGALVVLLMTGEGITTHCATSAGSAAWSYMPSIPFTYGETPAEKKLREDKETRDAEANRQQDEKARNGGTPGPDKDQNVHTVPPRSDTCSKSVMTLTLATQFVLKIDALLGGTTEAGPVAFLIMCSMMNGNSQTYIQSALKCACDTNKNRSNENIASAVQNVPVNEKHKSMRHVFLAFGGNHVRDSLLLKRTNNIQSHGIKTEVWLKTKSITLFVPYLDIKVLQLVDLFQSHADMGDVSQAHKGALTAFVNRGTLDNTRLDIQVQLTVTIAKELMRDMVGEMVGGRSRETEKKYKENVEAMLDGNQILHADIFDQKATAAFEAMSNFFNGEIKAASQIKLDTDWLVSNFDLHFEGRDLLSAFGKSHQKHRTEEEKKEHKRKKEEKEQRSRSAK